MEDLEKIIVSAEHDQCDWEKLTESFGQADVDDLKTKLIEHKVEYLTSSFCYPVILFCYPETLWFE